MIGTAHPPDPEGEGVTTLFDPATAPWRTWGSGIVCAATTDGENAGVIAVFDAPEAAEAACAARNAARDLTWLLDAGWLVQLGEARDPGNSPAGYYASVRRMGEIVSVAFRGETVVEAAAKARQWAEAANDPAR